MQKSSHRSGERIELVKKVCFGEGVLWIRPSPCPLPARGEGVFRCGDAAPTKNRTPLSEPERGVSDTVLIER